MSRDCGPRERHSFVFIDATYEHDGRHRAYEDWDFVDRPPCGPDVPQNWLRPINYVDGEYHLTVEVLSMKETPVQVGFGIGFCNAKDCADELHNCTSHRSIKFSHPGVYETRDRIRNMWYGNHNDTLGFEGACASGWDWSSWDWLFSFVVPYGCDPFPIKLRVTWTIFAARVEMPVIDPHGGRFSFPITELIGTRTPLARIHYTIDGSEPAPGSAEYMKQLVLRRSAEVKARAFKEGFDPSPIAAANFLVTLGRAR